MLEQYSTNYCICQEDSAFFRGSGGCFVGRWVFAVPVPGGGGLPFLSPADPAFCFPFCPLSPHPPSPAGKGRFFCFLMQGAPPLASPRLSRRQHRLTLRNRYPAGACPAGCRLTVSLWCPQGGLAFFVACSPLPLVCFLSPIPLTPFPSGEGGDFRLFHARGFAPCIPGG